MLTPCFVVIKMTSEYQRGFKYLFKHLSSVFRQVMEEGKWDFLPRGIKPLGFKAYPHENERRY